MNRDLLAVVGYSALIVGLIAFGLWMHFRGPCWAFTLKDAPLRCVVGR